MKQSGQTSCCLKSPSVSSMDQRDGRIQETTLVVPMGPANNNTKFHSLNQSKIQHRFPRKLAVDVKFSDIYYKARIWSITKKPEMKEILHGVSGEFKAGELTAIMGPSGAGKSTLLNILAGYKIRGSEGRVMVNGKDRSKAHTRLSCYIMQDDALRPKLTVIEAMTFAAHLKLGYTDSNSRKKQLMDVLEMLGLREHYKTRAGSLSGGQKKRLSIALELISNPPVIYLDEPTTGLDSSSCSQCVSLLKLLAQQGRTVVCTIHQPTALLFEMFDHLYALADGNCIYQGSIKGLLPFLGDLGLNCPTYHNPADFLIEVAIGEYEVDINLMAAAAAKNVSERRKNPMITSADAMAFKKIKTENGMQYASLASSENSSIDSLDEANNPPEPACLITQFLLLYYRNILILTRSYKSLLIRLLSHLIIGVIFGYLYQEVGHYADTVFGNYVYLYGTTLFLVYTSKMAVTLSIPLEMTTLKREYFNRWYKLLPSFLSIVLIEIPVQMLCSSTYIVISHYLTEQSTETYRVQLFYTICLLVGFTAQAFGLFIGVVAPLKIAVFLSPVIAVLFSTFGFNIFYKHIPEYFLWMYHISYFRAAFHSLTVIAYTQKILPCRELYCHYKTPEKFLDEIDVTDRDIGENLLFVGSFGMVFHIATVAAIWIKLNRR